MGAESQCGWMHFQANILRAKGPADVITANNVFAHADDLAGITKGVKSLLSPDGVFVFEVSYLFDVVGKTLFDTIYHEHLSYHSVEPLQSFFSKMGLEMIDAYRVDTHGGSLRGICERAGGPHKNYGSVAKLIALEQEAGLNKTVTYSNFFNSIEKVKHDLKILLKNPGET